MPNKNGLHRPLGVSFISSYIPRQCGIATFTNDLASCIQNDSSDIDVFPTITALNDIPGGYKYPADVKFVIRDKSINDFKEAANYLNLSDADVINLQHEYGLYGGEAGSNILFLADSLHKPLVTTLHTVLEKPSDDEYKVLREIGERSSYMIVQSKRAVRMLENIYEVPEEKIKFISHGAPDVPFIDTSYYKDKFRLAGKKVILTFGLLGPGKGMEDVINALASVVKEYPDVMYIILGATHPNVKRQFGESYRNMLENMVKKHGLEKNVMFINRFVENKELLEFLLMSDIYVSPYHNKQQIVSGTLTYALACGKAVVSTPYWYAEELLDNDRGILYPFKDTEALSKILLELLQDENKRNRLRKNAYDAGRELTWANIGKKYTEVFLKSIDEFKGTPYIELATKSRMPALPDINFTHMWNLTEDTGILQHATYSIGNPREGYCTDDNVRALLVMVMYKMMFNDERANPFINIYMRFVYNAYNRDKGLFRNFMSYERKWLDDGGSEDCNGRVIFTLGYIIKNTEDPSLVALTKSLFDESIQNMQDYKSPRAIAYILMGCIFYLHKFAGALVIDRICKKLIERLYQNYLISKKPGWCWYEDILAYSNGRLPHAMLTAGHFFKSQKFVEAGLESLTWLYEQLLEDDGKYVSLIGNNGWFTKGGQKAKYDQQPVEIPPLIDACYMAYEITKDTAWIDKISLTFSWYLGNNERQEPICDFANGGCFDGLTSTMINQNQGAEATISWLLSLLRMIKIDQDLKTNKMV